MSSMADTNVYVQTQNSGSKTGVDEAIIYSTLPIGEFERGLAFASSGNGYVKIHASAQTYNQNQGSDAVLAGANASTSDSLIIKSPGNTSAIAFVNVRIDVRGDQTTFSIAGIPGYAESSTSWRFGAIVGANSYGWSASISNTAGIMLLESYQSPDPLAVSPFGVATVRYPVVLDQPIPISFFITGEVSARNRIGRVDNIVAQAGAEIDLGHSVYWGGISSVEVGGVPVEYSVTSASGSDYRYSFAPVPEPSALLLLLIGIPVLVLRSRKHTKPA